MNSPLATFARARAEKRKNKFFSKFSFEESTPVHFVDTFAEAARVPPLHPTTPLPVMEEGASVAPTPTVPTRWMCCDYVAEKKFLNEFLASLCDGLPRWKQIKQMNWVLPQFKDDWERRYIARRISQIRAAGRRAAITRAFKKAQHEKNQESWFEGGEREAHYRRKHHYGDLRHNWLVGGIFSQTGMLQDTLDEESWEEVPEEESPLKGGRLRAPREYREPNLAPEGWVRPEQVPPPVRSIMLLTKLRAYIRALRTAPMSVWNRPAEDIKYTKWEKVSPQMEGLTGETPSAVHTGNVVLTEANPGSSAVAAENRFSYDWHQLCSTENTTEFNDLTERFTYYKTVEWKVDQNTGHEFDSFKTEVPCDIINSKKSSPGTMPIFIPFKIFRYFKSDVEFKFHVNSNKFQVGQLQFSFQYMEKYDGNPLSTIYSRCQLPHVLVNAGASNEATLYIPFKYMQPYLATQQRKNQPAALYLGTLRCMVIAPLAVGTGGPSSCSVSMFFRFPNAVFTGMRDGSIAEPQMEAAAAAMIASAAYDKFIGDRNCDNRSNNANPQFLVPTASHSWCAGTGLMEHVMSLRLDNTVLGVGRSGIDSSETNIAIPCRVFGMLKHFEWSTVDGSKNAPGTLLWSCDVNAQIAKAMCNSVNTEDGLDTYCIPPVSVVASLYRQWRGSLEFRFDIIAGMFHTGRLWCGYIPGAYGDMSITLEQARNSPGVEFSLQDSTSFTFIVPYICDKVFWPRKYTGPHKYSEQASPSKLVLFILNPLIPMQSVVDHVKIIPYVRAGTDFEVSVPVQPSIGLSDDVSSTYLNKEKIYPTPNSFPYRVTNYQGFGGGKKYIFYEGTAAFGTASTFHAPESKLKAGQYYYGKAEKSEDQPIMKFVQKTGKKEEARSYCSNIVLWYVPGKGNYGIPFPSNDEGEQQAKKVAGLLAAKAPTSVILPECYDYIEDSADTRTGANLKFKPVIVSAESWCMIDPQMMDPRVDAPVSLAPTNSLPSTSGGAFNYNESFTDLKDLARRYQLYADKIIKIPKTFSGSDTLAVFPVIPHGLALDVASSSSSFNLLRDGHIPVISSGFIYFRGSIRFKVVISSATLSLGGAKMWAQHHPDGDTGSRTISVYPNIVTEDRLKSHSYSLYMQALHVNSVMEFEVPFYQPGMYGLTRKPAVCDNDNDICSYYTLGNIVLGISVCGIEKPFECNLQIYYSIGDDFSFNVFRGFPPMVFTDEVWPDEVEEEKEIVWITGEPEMEDAQPEMMKSLIGYFSKSAVDAAVPAATEEIRGIVEGEAKKMRELFQEAYEKSERFTLSVPTVTAAIGNLAHVIANPTPRTLAIAVANVIISFFSESFVKLAKMIEALAAVFSHYWHRFIIDENAAEAQSDEDDRAAQQFCALVFTSVSALCGSCVSPPGKFPDVLRNINTGVSLYNNAIRFVQNSADMIKFCIQYIVTYLDPSATLNAQLLNEVPTIQDWFKECTYLLDVRNKERYYYDRSMLARVFDACMLGNLIVSQGMSKNIPAGKLVIDTQKEMCKMRSALYERGAHPDVRFEVFPIWMTGRPGIGKSFLVKRLVNDMLKSIHYEQPGTLIYDIPAGAKYWSGCQNPAVLVSDDIFQVSGTIFEDEIRNLFAICSSSVLNPPMAAVEDKERRLNPLIYLMLCNRDFPNLQPTCSTPEAVYRRRKFLIKATLRPEYDTPEFVDAGQLPREVITNMEHLHFFLAQNRTSKDQDPNYQGPYTYQGLLDIILPSFRRHIESERLNFKQRMIDMYCLDPNFDEQNIVDRLPELQNQPSLADQLELLRIRVRNKLDALEDPQREPEVRDYINQFIARVKALKGKILSARPEGDDEVMLDEPSTSKPIQNYIDLKYPEVFEQIKEFGAVLCGDSFSAQSAYSPLDYATCVDSVTSLYGDNLAFLETQVAFQLREMLGVTSTDVSSWYHSAMSNLVEKGNFDLFETLKFFCLFKNGPQNVVAMLCSREFEDKIDFKLDLDSVLRTEEVLAKVNSLNYNNNKKQALRRALKDMRFISPSGMLNYWRSMFAKDVHLELLKNKVPILDADIILEHLIKFYYDTVGSFRKNLTELDIGIQNLFKYLGADGLRKVSAVVLKYVGVYIVLRAVFIPGTRDCDNHKDYFSFLSSRIANAEFCSVRRKLVFMDKDVKMCSNPGCVYSNDLLYYFLCYSAVSCKKYQTVVSDAVGRDFVMCYEVDDVSRALRDRQKRLAPNIFARFARWLKCMFYHWLPETLSGIWNALVKQLPRILMVLGIATVCTGATLARDMVYDAYWSRNAPVKPEAYSFKFDQPKMPAKPKLELGTKHFVAPQANSATRSDMASKVERNTVLVYVSYVDDGTRYYRSCRCLMLRGRSMLILRHYWEEYNYLVKKGIELEVHLFFNNSKNVSKRNVAKCPVAWGDLQQVAWCSSDSTKITSNYGIVQCPMYVPQFPDIVKKFATKSEHSNLPSVCDLYVINGSSSFDMALTVKKNFCVSETASSSRVYMDRSYSYSHQSKGMCGSVLVANSLGSGNGAIIGMHVAGSDVSGNGYSEPIYREMFLAFFDAYPEPEPMPVAVQEDIEPNVQLDSNLLMYGCVPPKFAHKESGKSKIVPSLLHGEIYPVRTEVNPLLPNDPRQPPGSHPLRDGCEKHGSGDVRPFAAETMAEVKEYMADRIQQVIRPIRAELKPLTMQQAVCGDRDVPYFEALNWKSSEGFPLSAHRPKGAHDKKWLFELEEGQFGYTLKGLNPLLTQQLKLRQLCFEKGLKPTTVYVDCLKDYRLTPEKCKLPGKTRIFSIAPIQCSIDIRMWMNDFCASVKNSRIKNSIGIGINPDSMEWTELVTYLFEVGDKIITLDYSNYGPCLMSQTVAAGSEIIVEWFRYHGASEDHVSRVRWLLASDIINPVHLCDNVVYQTLNGIASGSPLTGELNSIPNLFYIRNCYLEIMRNKLPSHASMQKFDELVRIVVYGDDLIMSVADEIIEAFNALSIRDCLAVHGIKVTSAQKDAEMTPYSDIWHATFLKRSFREHPFRKGVWLAPLEQASVEECINWVHVSDNPQEATLECCRASLDLAYSQGPEYFSSHYEKLKRKMNEFGLVIPFKSWHQRDEAIFGSSSSSEEPLKLSVKMPWTYALSNFSL